MRPCCPPDHLPVVALLPPLDHPPAGHTLYAGLSPLTTLLPPSCPPPLPPQATMPWTAPPPGCWPSIRVKAGCRCWTTASASRWTTPPWRSQESSAVSTRHPAHRVDLHGERGDEQACGPTGAVAAPHRAAACGRAPPGLPARGRHPWGRQEEASTDQHRHPPLQRGATSAACRPSTRRLGGGSGQRAASAGRHVAACTGRAQGQRAWAAWQAALAAGLRQARRRAILYQPGQAAAPAHQPRSPTFSWRLPARLLSSPMQQAR